MGRAHPAGVQRGGRLRTVVGPAPSASSVALGVAVAATGSCRCVSAACRPSAAAWRHDVGDHGADGDPRFDPVDSLAVDGTCHVEWDEALDQVVDLPPLTLRLVGLGRRRAGLPTGWRVARPSSSTQPTARWRVASCASDCRCDGRVRVAVGPGRRRLALRQGDGHRGEHHGVGRRRRAEERRHGPEPRRGAHDAGRRRRHVRRPCSTRPTTPSTAVAVVPERRHVSGPHRRRRRRALLADHPLRPPRGGPSRAPATSTTPSRSTRSWPCGS